MIDRSAAQQVPEEIEQLELLVCALSPKVIVEIGSAQGGTLVRWMDVPGVELVVSIDLPQGPWGGVVNRDEVVRECSRYAKKQNVEFAWIDGDSRNPETMDKLKAILKGRTIDFCFIDGDHSYEGAKSDFETYGKLAKVVAFHDVLDSEFHKREGVEVPKLWQELRAAYNHDEFVYRDKSVAFWPHTVDGFGGIGVLYVEEPR